ncbi:hypothetical protein KIPB_017167, partial [Kipferlia bialata]
RQADADALLVQLSEVPEVTQDQLDEAEDRIEDLESKLRKKRTARSDKPQIKADLA